MKSLLQNTHPSWHGILSKSLLTLDSSYQKALLESSFWLPGKEHMFAAFSLPLSQVNYLLLGESPYPRECSANGYAFWDAAVDSLWSKTGLATAVNRATSLRNFIKMLLHARGDLNKDFSQAAIATLDKHSYVKTADELFQNMLSRGFLLLNASLVFRDGKVPQDAAAWQPFISCLLESLAKKRPDITLILFGKIAQKYIHMTQLSSLVAEHPYNISFIQNRAVIEFFKPLNLLALS